MENLSKASVESLNSSNLPLVDIPRLIANEIQEKIEARTRGLNPK